MEIVHLILGKANPDRMNGVNKVVYQLATKQKDAGKRVSCWGVTKNLTHDYGDRNFETLLFQAHRNPFKIDQTLKKHLLLQKTGIVVHLHGGWVPLYASLSLFLKKNKIPYVLTPHGAYNTIAMERSGWTKKIYFQLFEKNLLKNARKIHSLGKSEIEGLQKLYPNNKSVLIPYGFDLPVERNITPQKSDLFIVGFIGRLDIYTKGLDLLVEAFYNFASNKKNVVLWIIGDSNEKSILEKSILEKNLQNSVVLWGSKYGDEKTNLLKQMTVFTHPSRNEGIPTAVIEACVEGIPAIVSKATNIGEEIERFDAGITIADENSDALANAIEKLYLEWNNETLQQRSPNAIRLVEKTFNWNEIIEKIDKIYLND